MPNSEKVALLDHHPKPTRAESAVFTRDTETAQLREVGQELRVLMDGRLRQAAAYGTAFEELWRTASHCVLGGKLIRPLLLIGAFDALTSGARHSLRPSALRIAAAIELLHFSFLLHDDVIDEDLVRRGAPNLIGRLLMESEERAAQDGRRDGDGDGGAAGAGRGTARRAERLHWARSCGILMGDLALAAVHQAFARAPLPPDMRTRLLDLLDHAITESVAGEQRDVSLSDGMADAELRTVLEMTRLKTATYTFDLPLRAAALLAGAGPQVERTLGSIARHLGVAFQLQDDLMSVFGSPLDHGKDAFSDLREGKETPIIAYARTTPAWRAIEPRFGAAGLGQCEALEIRRLLTECGAEDFARSLVEDRIRAAREVMTSHGGSIPEPLGEFIADLVRVLEERSR